MIANRGRNVPDLFLPAAAPWYMRATYAGLIPAVDPTPEAAPLANDDSYTTNDVTVVTGNLFDNDTPGDVPLQVTAVNGSSLAVGLDIILASGARLHVNSNGSFTYNPNGAFNSVPATDDHFTYTIAGGDGATVTVTVQDPPNPNIGTDNPETLTGTPGDDVMDAKGGDDIVYGLAGNDVIDGGTGADSMIGGTDNDTYKVDNAGDTITEADGEGYDIIVATVNYTLAAGVYVEELTTTAGRSAPISLTGNDFDNIIRGGNGNDTLTGAGGNDTFYGGLGLDALNGGANDDIYYVNAPSGTGSLSDTITEADGGGYDIAYVTQSGSGPYAYILNAGAYVELIALDPTADPNVGVFIQGNELVNELRGSAGADQLYGGGGADTMIGYAGADRYQVDNVGDVIVEQENQGTDLVLTSIDWTLGANLEFLQAENATGPLSLQGNELNNSITGGQFGDIILGLDGDDRLNGGAGNDSLYGGAGNDNLDPDGGGTVDLMDGGTGNDLYFVDNINDVVSEAFEAGQTLFVGDRVTVGINNYTLAAGSNIEGIAASGNGSVITLTGNDDAQAIFGNFANNFLFGKGGDDILIGDTGVDRTDGGFGDDQHYVENPNDVVIERAGEGFDTVYASLSYALTAGAYVELLVAAGSSSTSPINLIGNELSNTIWGNNGNNVLKGGGGGDAMLGFGGDDTYFVTDPGDRVLEDAGGGNDTIYASFSYGLTAGAYVELLSADGIANTYAINLNGNELSNTIWGNNGANIFHGGGGGDAMLGFGGDDVYYVTDPGDRVLEDVNKGFDILYTDFSYGLTPDAYIELLSADGIANTYAINLNGNALSQTIWGNNGVNIIKGGGGGDAMLGFGGDDTYFVTDAGDRVLEDQNAGNDTVYSTISFTLTAGSYVELLSTDGIGNTNAINLTGNELSNTIWGNNGANVLNGGLGGDALIGFGGVDTFAFTTALGSGNVDNILDFTAGTDKIALDDAVFTAIGGLGTLNASAFFAGTAAHDADDRIIYDQASGNLYYDADGNGGGAQILFATLQSQPTIAASDFQVI